MSDDRINELEHRSIETSQSETQREKKKENKNCGVISKGVTYAWSWNTRRRSKNKAEKNI